MNFSRQFYSNKTAMKVLVVFISALACTWAIQVPTFVHACNLTSPDFHDCALEQAHTAVPHIIKGIRNLRIPPLDPLNLPEVNFYSPNLNIKFEDLIVTGLKDVKIFDMSLSKARGSIDLHLDVAEINAHYIMDGRILILPIQGDGRMNLTAVGGNYTYTCDFEPFQKKGKNYAHVKNPKLTYKVTRAYFDFENLFNGDERLGKEMNKFVNEHWEDVIKEVGGAISETIGAVATNIVSNVFGLLTQEQLFLE